MGTFNMIAVTVLITKRCSFKEDRRFLNLSYLELNDCRKRASFVWIQQLRFPHVFVVYHFYSSHAHSHTCTISKCFGLITEKVNKNRLKRIAIIFIILDSIELELKLNLFDWNNQKMFIEPLWAYLKYSIYDYYSIDRFNSRFAINREMNEWIDKRLWFWTPYHIFFSSPTNRIRSIFTVNFCKISFEKLS